MVGIELQSPLAGQSIPGYVFPLRGKISTAPGGPSIDRMAVLGGDRLARGLTRRVSETCHEFSMAIGCASQPPEFQLDVSVVLEGPVRIQLVRIAGRRSALESDFEPTIQPLLITTLGRSGSTILAAAMGTHPNVIAYRPLGREPRAAAYWTDVFRELSDPVSSGRQLAHGGQPGMSDRGWWLGKGVAQEFFDDDPVAEWLGRDHVRSLAAYCVGRVESLYACLARDADKPNARYFVEKTRPDGITSTMRDLYPKRREVILVRDLRDMFCSMRAWSDRLGTPVFGRGGAGGDQQHLDSLKMQAERLFELREELGDRCRLVRYEDLVLDTAATLRGVLDHLELDTSSEVIEEMSALVADSAPATDRHRTTASGRESIGRWQRDLDDDLREWCEEHLGAALIQFGYEQR